VFIVLVNHLGTYKTKEIAAYAYNQAARQFYKEFASLNDVETPENMIWDSEKLRLIQV
jgi:hypothetical protein